MMEDGASQNGGGEGGKKRYWGDEKGYYSVEGSLECKLLEIERQDCKGQDIRGVWTG